MNFLTWDIMIATLQRSEVSKERLLRNFEFLEKSTILEYPICNLEEELIYMKMIYEKTLHLIFEIKRKSQCEKPSQKGVLFVKWSEFWADI